MENKDFMHRVGIAVWKSADQINEESWRRDVLKELDRISIDCAKQLQVETHAIYRKPARPKEGVDVYDLGLHKAPHMRLLALEIGLAAWLGWIMQEKLASTTTTRTTNLAYATTFKTGIKNWTDCVD